MTEGSPDVLCSLNENGIATWVSNEKAITEFDPFFICAYGYQDQSDQSGPRHLIWCSIAGAPNSLTRTFTKREDAMSLLDRIRQLKKRH